MIPLPSSVVPRGPWEWSSAYPHQIHVQHFNLSLPITSVVPPLVITKTYNFFHLSMMQPPIPDPEVSHLESQLLYDQSWFISSASCDRCQDSNQSQPVSGREAHWVEDSIQGANFFFIPPPSKMMLLQAPLLPFTSSPDMAKSFLHHAMWTWC